MMPLHFLNNIGLIVVLIGVEGSNPSGEVCSGLHLVCGCHSEPDPDSRRLCQ